MDLNYVTKKLLKENNMLITNENAIASISLALEDNIDDILLTITNPVKVINNYINENRKDLAYQIIADELSYNSLPNHVNLTIKEEDIDEFSRKVLLYFNNDLSILQEKLSNEDFIVMCDEETDMYYMYSI